MFGFRAAGRAGQSQHIAFLPVQRKGLGAKASPCLCQSFGKAGERNESLRGQSPLAG